MQRVFFDLDGPTVDFERYMRESGLNAEQVKRRRGAYLAMHPVAGAIESIRKIISFGYEAWIATKPPTAVAYAYSDKVQWVLKYVPELKRHIILTHDKGLLGDEGDFLIDDRPHKANCQAFAGTFIHFEHRRQWPEIVERLRLLREQTGALQYDSRSLRDKLLTRWIEEEGGAMRSLAFPSDGLPRDVRNRVAFIEKTPRVRVGLAAASSDFDLCEDGKNWLGRDFKGSGPQDEESRAWCDEQLAKEGYVLPC